MDIALGTVQFGLDYGINNPAGKVKEEEVGRILDFAWRSGIRYLDTASSYGHSEEVLGKYLKVGGKDFKVISKLNPIQAYDKDLVCNNVDASLKKLSLDCLYGYLVHRFEDFISFPQVIDDLQAVKRSGKIKKVGFSLYSPDELDKLWANDVAFDLVQVPYSIFDRRFELYFEKLKQKGIEVHVRSVFLQGLAFMGSRALPENLKNAEAQIKKLEEVARRSGLSRGEICLNFGLMNSYVDRVVFGVDSLKQLEDNLISLTKMNDVKSLEDQLRNVEIKDESILLPYLWSQR